MANNQDYPDQPYNFEGIKAMLSGLSLADLTTWTLEAPDTELAHLGGEYIRKVLRDLNNKDPKLIKWVASTPLPVVLALLGHERFREMFNDLNREELTELSETAATHGLWAQHCLVIEEALRRARQSRNSNGE